MKKVRIKLKNTPQVKKYNEVLKKASKMTKKNKIKIKDFQYTAVLNDEKMKNKELVSGFKSGGIKVHRNRLVKTAKIIKND